MPESTLFKTTYPNQPMDVLLLVENSQAMSFIWDDLRDRYLGRLMDRLNRAAELTPGLLKVWVLESQPLQASSTTQPRQYQDPHHALNDVCLNYMPENRISSTRIESAIEFLTNLASPGEPQGHALHLIIVAVSTPIDSDADFSADMHGGRQYSTWGRLAAKLAQANVYCHTLTRSMEDMSALTTLFNETLRLERAVEDLVSFPADSEVSLRLSTRPAAPSNFPSYGQVNPPPRPVRIAMPPRRNTFPLDTCYTEQSAGDIPPQSSHSSEMDPPTSLVSQLQQVHGLMKKKVYGTKPARKPFFTDERVDQHNGNFQAAAVVAMGPIPPPPYPSDSATQQSALSSSGGRVMSQSKMERLARLQASPIDMQGRRHHVWAGRNSRLASPDQPEGASGSPGSLTGYSDISPTASYISSDVSSPITPASTEDYYGVRLQGSPSASALGGLSAVVDGGPSDPTWLQTAYSQGYITPSSHLMTLMHQGYYMPAPPSAASQYYDGALVGQHGLDVYSNTSVTQEMPLPMAPVVENLPKAPANLSSQTASRPKASSPPAPSEAPVTQTSTPPPPPPSTKKSKRKQEPVDDDQDYIILDQQFAEYGASINEEFANMLKEKDAEKIRELRASGTEDTGASKPELDASSSAYAAPTDVQGYLPGRGGDSTAASSRTHPPSPRNISSISPGSISSMQTKPTSMPLLASASPTPSASPGQMLTMANDKAYAPSASLGFDGSYSTSYYPVPHTFAIPPSQQVVDPRFLPAIPSRVAAPIGMYSYHPPATYPSQGTSSNLTSNSLTGWAG